MKQLLPPLLLFAAFAAAEARAQFATQVTAICAGCPFSQLLLEWDAAPGADELVQVGDALWVRSNDGLGGFGPAQFVTGLPAGEELVLFEDADGDGDTDLFTHLNGTVHLIRNEGGSFATVLLDTELSFDYFLNHPAEFGAVRAMHVDDDGLMDLCRRWNSGNTFIWYRNDGAGGYVKTTETLPVTIVADGEVVAIDWDNDGLNDLVTTTDSEVHGVVLLGSNGGWSSEPDTICTALSAFGMRFWDVADLNNDGVPDLLNPQNMFISHPDSAFYRRHWITEYNYNAYRRIMDLDCDDRPEIFGKAMNIGNAAFHVLHAQGDSLVLRTWEQLDPFLISYMQHVVADLDADGAPDLLFKEMPFPEATFYARYNLAVPPEVTLNLPFGSVTPGSTVALTGGTPEGGTWSGDGVVGDSLFTALAPGGPFLITYTYTNAFGCSGSAEALVDLATHAESMNAAALLKPYPQPADAWAWLPAAPADATVLLHDALGRTIIPPVERHGGQLRIATHTLPAGSYALRVMAPAAPTLQGRLVVGR